MINYDKSEIRQQVTLENVFDIVEEWGGTPEYTTFGLLATTICHNHPGVGSHKLYYYENSGLFKCYTECDEAFDIFQLIEKIFKIQKNEVQNFFVFLNHNDHCRCLLWNKQNRYP